MTLSTQVTLSPPSARDGLFIAMADFGGVIEVDAERSDGYTADFIRKATNGAEQGRDVVFSVRCVWLGDDGWALCAIARGGRPGDMHDSLLIREDGVSLKLELRGEWIVATPDGDLPWVYDDEDDTQEATA